MNNRQHNTYFCLPRRLNLLLLPTCPLVTALDQAREVLQPLATLDLNTAGLDFGILEPEAF